MSWYWKKDLRLKDENLQAWEKYSDQDIKRIEKEYQKNKKGSFSFDDTYQIDFERMINIVKTMTTVKDRLTVLL